MWKYYVDALTSYPSEIQLVRGSYRKLKYRVATAPSVQICAEMKHVTIWRRYSEIEGGRCCIQEFWVTGRRRARTL